MLPKGCIGINLLVPDLTFRELFSQTTLPRLMVVITYNPKVQAESGSPEVFEDYMHAHCLINPKKQACYCMYALMTPMFVATIKRATGYLCWNGPQSTIHIKELKVQKSLPFQLLLSLHICLCPFLNGDFLPRLYASV